MLRENEQRILDAAIREFASKGYAGATTKNIASEANVNEVTLFRKFQSKENLLRAVITRARDGMHRDADSIFLGDKAVDLESSLHNVGGSLRRLLEERRDLMILLISEAGKNPRVAKTLSAIPKMALKYLSDYFEHWIRKGEVRKVNPQVIAFALLSYLLLGNLAAGLFGDIPDQSDEAFDEFIDILVRGISEHPPRGDKE